MQFRDKTAYVWGLRYRWDPSLSRNPVPRFPHFMPPCRCVKFLTYLKDICKRPASCLVFFSVGNGGAGAIAGKTPSVIIRLYMIGIVFPDRIVLFLVLKKYCAWKSSSDAKLDFSSWNNLTIGRSGWVSAKLPWNQLVQSIYTWGLSFFLKIALA